MTVLSSLCSLLAMILRILGVLPCKMLVRLCYRLRASMSLCMVRGKEGLPEVADDVSNKVRCQEKVSY